MVLISTASPNASLMAATPRVCCLVHPISAAGDTNANPTFNGAAARAGRDASTEPPSAATVAAALPRKNLRRDNPRGARP